MKFLNPQFLFLIALLPVWLFFVSRRKTGAYFNFSSIDIIRRSKKRKMFFSRYILVMLRALTIIFILIALARPQVTVQREKITTEGIDIIVAVDTSTSMLAEDFTFAGKRQNRLYVVKRVVENFIKARRDDKIGITVFAGRAYMACPLTLDYDWVINNLDRIEIGMVEDGTAIGSAIISGLNRLRYSKAKSKIIVLLTDGRNNAGNISPQAAAYAAKAMGVKIYTIGAGTKGLAPYPVQDFFGNKVYQPIKIDIDDESLTKVAEITGGEFFRATDTDSLKQIYKNIDQLEKTQIEETGYTEYKELFVNFLIIGFAVLIFEIILSQTLLRRIP